MSDDTVKTVRNLDEIGLGPAPRPKPSQSPPSAAPTPSAPDSSWPRWKMALAAVLAGAALLAVLSLVNGVIGLRGGASPTQSQVDESDGLVVSDARIPAKMVELANPGDAEACAAKAEIEAPKSGDGLAIQSDVLRIFIECLAPRIPEDRLRP